MFRFVYCVFYGYCCLLYVCSWLGKDVMLDEVWFFLVLKKVFVIEMKVFDIVLMSFRFIFKILLKF